MNEHTWRVIVGFETSSEARTLANELARTTKVADAQGSLLYTAGFNDLVVYAPTPKAIEEVARIVRSTTAEAGLRPTRIRTALWLVTESCWSDAPGVAPPRSFGDRAAKAGVDAGFNVVASLVESLFNLP